ncbi:cell 5a endo--betaglucanase [Plasmopara halstedii]|uniref:Cell 5a endo--betaglucanase n=1 Tax=Plasmopara halstedii TaxID=4781 RepID=A0A0P1B1B9_PLAHL|nr:cell 5a endo--betaglucanase [Plasmopara halstedii]CEG48469.1 cell 5a endo--betaglucanase [Plasmopara halstedii]|eukprot:XP_024584838.1 cell 5a endo--betaglucanase [Plasmopara halstedii]
MSGRPSNLGRSSFTGGRSSEVERIIAAADVDTTFAGKKARYRGRHATWPGALALLLLAFISIFGLTYYGIQVHDNVNETVASSEAAEESRYTDGTQIRDGSPSDTTSELAITNPKMYLDRKCEQPNYISKNGRIFAQFSDQSTTQIDIKGINWKGMEDSKGVPKGLWDNTVDGDSLYRFGYFLHYNKFNVVRFPLSIDSVMRNTEIDMNLINSNSNRALGTASRYNTLLGLLVQGLGQFNIGVVLDFHVLSATDDDGSGLWYGSSIKLNDIKTAITNLAEEMCDSTHFNIIGIDLKDGLKSDATWGDGADTDWSIAATELANHMLNKCPKWLAFIQGVQGESHKDMYGERSLKNTFLPGSDLSGITLNPIKLKKENKIVYAPKFFSSSESPRQFFFQDGQTSGNLLEDYVELEDADLLANVKQHMNYSFGAAFESGSAVVLSSFGGLVGKLDETKMKTSTRIIENVISQMAGSSEPFLAGGFWWTLNPDTTWPYPAPDNSNSTKQGLLDETWRTVNMEVLKTLADMNTTMKSVKFIPCLK